MLGGAPGIGKSTVARRLLEIAEGGPHLVQWIDVDSLWLHQPWRADERMTAMMRANLRSVAGHAKRAGVDVLLITWVFQSGECTRSSRRCFPRRPARCRSSCAPGPKRGPAGLAADRNGRA